MIHGKFSRDLLGWLYGFVGILIFSLTLPATRLAVSELDPVFVGLGRAIIAASLSLILLILTRQNIPPKRFLPSFVIVAAGVIIGFPLLSAIAMKNAPASHGAIIVGLLPLATAGCGVWRGKERVSNSFWIFALIGSGLVICFALIESKGSFNFTELALIGAVLAASIGYTEGAFLAFTLGAWQVICWSLLLATPILLPIVWQLCPSSLDSISLNAWSGFFYVGIFSMFLGFIAWYKGLSMGGIANISQIQLLQPFLTILASALLLGETLTLTTIAFAGGVIVCVFLGKRLTIQS
ncbi:MAG: DMT family transporter [Pleurocapsa sp.]